MFAVSLRQEHVISVVRGVLTNSSSIKMMELPSSGVSFTLGRLSCCISALSADFGGTECSHVEAVVKVTVQI